MMKNSFVHLHNHTEYSLLDGALRIKDLVQEAGQLGMPAVAMTDHGVLYGMIEFYHQAENQGIKPIIGCEVYLAPGSCREKKTREMYHLILLAMDKQGYHNLIKLVSLGWLEGFYYKPRVDKELLSEYSKGLIALSACIQGEIPRLILQNRPEEAEQTARDYRAIFGQDNFFLELQDHLLPEEKKVNSKLIQMASRLDLPLVVTNDVHYLRQDDADLHSVLLALQTGKKLSDEDRLSFPNDQFYFKNQAEMYELFPDLEEAYQNTLRIAERCDLKLDFNTFYLPDYPDVEEGRTLSEMLRDKCESGLIERGMVDNPEVRERLDYELKIIKEMGYVSYFLIVWDFIDYAERNGIRVGPGRGSAAGSLVSYLLRITRINPLKYNLIFERFLNPERITMPDIDIDFDEQRDKIIEYVRQRYGEKKVAQIGTFGTMAARAAIRDVGRVIDLPLKKVDRIAKMVPVRPGVTLEEAFKDNPKLARYYQDDPEIKELIDYARGVEGLPRHISTHAAGVVIGPDDLTGIIPLQIQDKGIITQLPMNNLEELGLLKMDFLGLRNLTVINKSLQLIKERHGIDLEIDDVPLDDSAVYRLLQQGKTLGVFQMESFLFQDLNQKLKPDRFTDLIALLALGRPGPLGSNLVDQFIAARHGQKDASYLHASLEPILAETFGLILYQEQVMEIASKLAGYSMGEADLLRRGMGKKKRELMANERERFVQGANARGIDGSTANAIFDQMEYFSGYGFNKSHSTAYAMLAYQTAYLKVKYPAEFMAALLSSVMNNLDKVGQYVRECREMSLEVLPPDINKSVFDFKPVTDEKIHFGLKAIKNVGENAIKAIIEGRKSDPYHSLEDFIKRVDLKRVNIQVIESLIKAGAFSSFQEYRSQMLTRYAEIYEKASTSMRGHSAAQTSFFDLVEKKEFFYQEQTDYPEMDELGLEEKLAQEKEYLGIYLSAHPLDQYSDKISYFTNSDSQNFKEREEATLAGIIVNRKDIITRKKRQMAFLTVEDWAGEIQVVVFPDLYNRVRELLYPGAKVLFRGRVGEDNILADNIISLEKVFLEVTLLPGCNDILSKLLQICQANKGDIPLFFRISRANNSYLVMSSNRYWVTRNETMEQALTNLIGKERFRFV
jgi:DNA polymerase III subunit alpha